MASPPTETLQAPLKALILDSYFSSEASLLQYAVFDLFTKAEAPASYDAGFRPFLAEEVGAKSTFEMAVDQLAGEVG